MVRLVPLVAALFVAGLVARTLAQDKPKPVDPPKTVAVEVFKKSDEPITNVVDKNKHKEACEKIHKVELANNLITLGHDSEASDSNRVAALFARCREILHHTTARRPF